MAIRLRRTGGTTSTPQSVLLREARSFRTKLAPNRLAELILTHVDHPSQFFDWSDFEKLCSRADRFLAPGHRFSPPPPVPPAKTPAHATALPTRIVAELLILKRIRNAIAHKSDKAWDSFIKLVSMQPFGLTPKQRKGITPGRFLSTAQWSGSTVIRHSLTTLEGAAKVLAP